MGTATYGTRRLAGSAAHAGPLLIDTGMADGSWCAGMGTGCWSLAYRGQVGSPLELLGTWDTRTISIYMDELRTWPVHSHSLMHASHKMVIGYAVISAAYGIHPWTSQRLRIS